MSLKPHFSQSVPEETARVARKNVELTMAHIREKSAVPHDLESTRALKVAGAMYNESIQIWGQPRTSATIGISLAHHPAGGVPL
jgi:carbonic anhydrase